MKRPQYDPQTFLRNFIEKAEKIDGLPFAEHVRATNIEFTISIQELHTPRPNMSVVEKTPSENDRDAFLLTFRMFFHETSDCALVRLFTLAAEEELAPELNARFRAAKVSYDRFLNERIPIRLHAPGLPPPSEFLRRELIKTFLYGNLGHFDARYQAIFDSVRNLQPLYAMLNHSFLESLRVALEGITKTLLPLAKLALDELRTKR